MGCPRHPGRETHDERFRLWRIPSYGHLSPEDPEHHEELRELRFDSTRPLIHHQESHRQGSHGYQKDNHQYSGGRHPNPSEPVPDVSGDRSLYRSDGRHQRVPDIFPQKRCRIAR